jgi:hypothetical protein
MNPDSTMLRELAETCPHCGDSGYAESYRGAVWVHGPMTVTLSYCDCPQGEDLQLELATLSVAKFAAALRALASSPNSSEIPNG